MTAWWRTDRRTGRMPRSGILGLFDVGDPRLQDGDPGKWPYRADHLRSLGTELRTVSPLRGRIPRKVRDVVEHRLGVQLDLALRGIPAAFRSEAVLCMLEPEARFPAWLKEHRVPPYAALPIWAVACWWGEEIRHGDAQARRAIEETCRQLAGVFVFSANQVEDFVSIGVPQDKIHPVSFGADSAFYVPGERDGGPGYGVVAIGVDRGRDYATLCAAARLMPDLTVHIVTRPAALSGLEVPDNVLIHGPVGHLEYRRILQTAELVVIPTHSLAYPTGQSVLLEAGSCGAAVAVTGTEAMRGYFEDGVTAFDLPLHDADGVARVIASVMADEGRRRRVGAAARHAVEERFNLERMWSSIHRTMSEGL